MRMHLLEFLLQCDSVFEGFLVFWLSSPVFSQPRMAIVQSSAVEAAGTKFSSQEWREKRFFSAVLNAELQSGFVMISEAFFPLWQNSSWLNFAWVCVV